MLPFQAVHEKGLCSKHSENVQLMESYPSGTLLKPNADTQSIANLNNLVKRKKVKTKPTFICCFSGAEIRENWNVQVNCT